MCEEKTRLNHSWKYGGHLHVISLSSGLPGNVDHHPHVGDKSLEGVLIPLVTTARGPCQEIRFRRSAFRPLPVRSFASVQYKEG